MYERCVEPDIQDPPRVQLGLSTEIVSSRDKIAAWLAHDAVEYDEVHPADLTDGGDGAQALTKPSSNCKT